MNHEVIAASRMIRDDLYQRQTYIKRCLERLAEGRMPDANPPIVKPPVTAEKCDYRIVSGHLSPEIWRALFHCEHAWARIHADGYSARDLSSLDRILDDVRKTFTDELDPEMIHRPHQLPTPKDSA